MKLAEIEPDQFKGLKTVLAERLGATGQYYQKRSDLDAKLSSLLTHVSIMIAVCSFLMGNVEASNIKYVLAAETIVYILITLGCLLLLRLYMPISSSLASTIIQINDVEMMNIWLSDSISWMKVKYPDSRLENSSSNYPAEKSTIADQFLDYVKAVDGGFAIRKAINYRRCLNMTIYTTVALLITIIYKLYFAKT